jgi:hypothetical protein
MKRRREKKRMILVNPFRKTFRRIREPSEVGAYSDGDDDERDVAFPQLLIPNQPPGFWDSSDHDLNLSQNLDLNLDSEEEMRSGDDVA